EPAPRRCRRPRGPKYCGHTHIFILGASGWLRDFPNNHCCAGPSCIFVSSVLVKTLSSTKDTKIHKGARYRCIVIRLLNAQSLLREPHTPQQLIEPRIGAERVPQIGRAACRERVTA